MAEPKKRTNKSKTGMRRMHIRALRPSLNYCSNCHEAKLSHRVCPSCGFYKGKQVVIKDVKDQKDKEGQDDKEEKETKEAEKQKHKNFCHAELVSASYNDILDPETSSG